MSVRTGGFRVRPGVVTLGVVAVVVGGVTVAGPASADQPTPGATTAVTVDPTSKASVLQGYQQTWVRAMAVPSGWTGSTASCTPGTDSAAAQRAVLTAVNFARGLVNRPPVRMDAALSTKALAAGSRARGRS